MPGAAVIIPTALRTRSASCCSCRRWRRTCSLDPPPRNILLSFICAREGVLPSS